MATVIKIGGSLYDLPNLGQLLRSFLEGIDDSTVMLFPGGGQPVDIVRAYDAVHGLGEEASHLLALRMLHVNAHFLAALLPGFPVVTKPIAGRRAILDPSTEPATADEETPHSWQVTSDTLALRAAVVHGAREL